MIVTCKNVIVDCEGFKLEVEKYYNTKSVLFSNYWPGYD